jgi:rhomboid protease GluP
MEQPPISENWQILPGDLQHEDREVSLTRRQARSRSLVLSARMIPHVIDRSTGVQQLRVPPEYYSEALRQLRLHAHENRGWPPLPPEIAASPENYLSTLAILGLLLLFNGLTLQKVTSQSIDWNSLGNAHADLILNGEWWRAVTALTLHADGIHLLGNLVVGGFFMLWLCREFGSGLGWTLCLMAGSAGNLLNAWLQHPAHRSIGASTAVFGVLGIAATYNFLRYRQHLGRRQLVPLAAACALLALLGVGEETTDIGAHLFGFGAGLALGAMMGTLFQRHERPGKMLNGALALISSAIVIFSWIQALSS